MPGAEHDRALLRLARGRALGRRLDAVIDRVPEQMIERRFEEGGKIAVDIGTTSVDLEADLLPQLARQIA